MNKKVKMNKEEAFAFLMCKAYMRYASIAKDGTIFVPSPICEPVASPHLAIVQISKNGEFVRLFSNKLYANLDVCTKVALEM